MPLDTKNHQWTGGFLFDITIIKYYNILSNTKYIVIRVVFMYEVSKQLKKGVIEIVVL